MDKIPAPRADTTAERVGFARRTTHAVCVWLDGHEGHEVRSLLRTWALPVPGSRRKRIEMARMRRTLAAGPARRPHASTALSRRPVARPRENRPRRCRSASSQGRAGPGDDGPGDPPGRLAVLARAVFA